MTADEKAPKNRSEAESAGFAVDRTCYPWVAYKGPRFQPAEFHYIDTDREASLREDAERLDALVADLLSEALLLHNNAVLTLGCRHRGLGLLGGRRTLRQAIDGMRRAEVGG